MKWFKVIALLLTLILVPNCKSITYIDEEVTKSLYLYDNITIEIQPIDGVLPAESALQSFKNLLIDNSLCRPGGVSIVIKANIKSQGILWDEGRVDSLESEQRTLHDGNLNDRHLILFVSYVKGPFLHGSTTGLAGLRYGNTSFVVIKNGDDISYEDSVLLHELGHVLNIAKDRKNPANPDRPRHCNNEECVMFWRVSKKGMSFDQECKKDINRLLAGQRLF